MASEYEKQIQSIDIIYATALADLAQEAGQIDDISQEVRDLGKLLETQPGLLHLLASLVLTAGQRSEAIEKIFKGRVSDLLYRFLQTVNEKHRLGDLPKMIRAFVAIYEDRRGVVEVDAHVATRMDDAQAQAVAGRLGQAIGRTVLLHQFEDPALIGGLKVRIADKLIDGSVAAQLRIIKQKMIDTGREKARQQTTHA